MLFKLHVVDKPFLLLVFIKLHMNKIVPKCIMDQWIGLGLKNIKTLQHGCLKRALREI